jgi:transposase InsO family protein
VIEVSIDNEPRKFLVDTGSSVCLIQPNVSSVKIQASAIAPIGITGDSLPLLGEQLIEFRLDKRQFRQKFGVCVLPTTCDGILGTNFLIANEATIDLKNQRLLVSQTGRGAGSEIYADVAYTLFPAGDGQDGRSAQQEAVTELKREPGAEAKPAPNVADISDKQEWLVTLPASVKLTPRAKQMLIGQLEVPKSEIETSLVCIEPAQLPSEGILVARGISRAIVQTQQSNQPQRRKAEKARTASVTSQGRDVVKAAVHVMVVNFSHEEVELQKGTVLGVAEEVSDTLVAAVNDGPVREPRSETPKVQIDASFQSYLNDKLSHLTDEERAVLEPVLVKYRKTFYVEGSNDFPGTDLVEHEIDTGNTRPIRRPPYRVPYALRDELDRQVETMLDKGIIEPSASAWNFPAILIPKRSLDGKPNRFRFCIDFRALNQVTKPDVYYLPVFEETMSTLHGSRYFSTLDCESGFHQVNVAEADRDKTSFTTPLGSFRFRKMAFGLCNGPSTFQRLMDVALKELRGTELWVFLDDLIVFSDTIEEHAIRLEHVFQRFEKAKLLLQPAKCVFAKSEVKYLGYVVSSEGISASPDKIKAVRDYPRPENVKDVRSFVGLASFYRRLIPKFADLAKPLTELTRKETEFVWGETQETAFNSLKEKLCSSEVLAFPDFKSDFTLTTDGSGVGIAAILSQVQNGVERPVSYASRQLSKTEQNYTASEIEMLAVVWSLRVYRTYLYARHFIVKTDHAALTFLHKFSGNNARLLRWSLRLAEYDFEVHYRPGAKIPHVDSLSRHICALASNPAVSKDKVGREQAKDAFCQAVKVGDSKGKTEFFKDEDGVIYKRHKGGEPLLVVPESLVNEILSLNHDSVYAAHPGRHRMLDILKLKFWWKGMSKHVDEYVKNCDACQRRHGRQEFKAPMGKVREPTRQWEIVHMDTVGPLQISDKGNKYILTFVDSFSKYVEAIALPDICAITCARAYASQVITRHGVNDILVTDNGTSFTAVFFNEVCKILGVKHITTSPCHAAGNGQIERVHRTMKKALSCFVNASGGNWDEILPYFLMSYRASPHSSSGHSPFFLLHGREMNLPHTHNLRAKLTPGAQRLDEAGRLRSLQATISRANKVVRENLRKSRARNKKYYDRAAKPRVLRKGQIVYLHNPARKPGVSQKFTPVWKGPFAVRERVGELDYKIVDMRGKESVVHINRLKGANNPHIWKPKAVARDLAPPKQAPKSRREREKSETPETSPVLRPRPIVNLGPPIENPVNSPDRDGDRDRDLEYIFDTPEGVAETPEALRADPNYVLPSTPRRRVEQGTNRFDPPMTRARARLNEPQEEIPERTAEN